VTPTKQVSTSASTAAKAPLSSAIIARLNEAMAKSATVWVSYDGGANAKQPRQMKPLKWEREPVMFTAFCMISNSVKNWTTSKVVEVRDEKWTVEQPTLFTPLKKSDGTPDEEKAAPADSVTAAEPPAPAVAPEPVAAPAPVPAVVTPAPAAAPAAAPAPATN
jgi:hypothetical protein